MAEEPTTAGLLAIEGDGLSLPLERQLRLLGRRLEEALDARRPGLAGQVSDLVELCREAERTGEPGPRRRPPSGSESSTTTGSPPCSEP